jgi:hypothetical protein
VLAVSDLALIILTATDGSFAHLGTSPQPKKRQFADRLLRVLANYRDKLSGGNVVARIPIFHSRDAIEVFLKNLLSPRQTVSPAHREIMADRASL